MKTLYLQQASLAEYFKLIEGQSGRTFNIFRGQADKNWCLVPSLYRLNIDECVPVLDESFKSRFEYLEKTALNLFFNEGHPYLPYIEKNYLNDMILAQHFGVPTRLLDWSTDPLVALYFAVEDYQSDKKTDAVVYMILPNFMGQPQEIIDKRIMPLEGEASLQVIAFRPPAVDRRIIAQRSIFTLHPHDETKKFVPLEVRSEIGYKELSSEERCFAKIVIPANFKTELYTTLWHIGIDKRTLFPGLDGVGADIAARIKAGEFMR